MILHYVTVALAKVRRAPFTTAANVLTLALGLACFIAAYGIATFWSSGDAYHPDADRIVYIRQADAGPADFGIRTAAALPAALKDEFPELEAVAQIWGRESSIRAEAPFSSGEADTYLRAAWADAGLFDVFAFEFVEGGPDTALRAPRDVVLTEDAARRLFGREPALGKTVVGRLPTLVPRETPAVAADYTVSAVIDPVRQPSFMGHTSEAMVSFDLLANIALQFPSAPTSWPNPIGGTTIVQLPPSMPIEVFQARLDDFVSRIEDPAYTFSLEAVPIGELVAQLVDARFLSQSSAGVSTSAVLLGLGLLILIVACVNYANLAAAQAASRLKETGMRRALGAGWRDLLTQHLLEAALLTLPALALALMIVGLATPIFRSVLGVEVGYFLADPRGILVLLAVSLASASAAALYPALGLMRARAADALGEARIRWGFVPRLLVGVQFLSASFLLIVVSVAGEQQAHMKALAFDQAADPVVVLDGIPAGDFDTFKTELLKTPQIRAASAVGTTPWVDRYGAVMSIAPPGAPPGGWRIAQMKYVGPDYFETLDLALLAGRTFDLDRDRTLSRDRAGIIEFPSAVIERRLAEFLGYDDPQAAIGQTFARPDGRGDVTILGVVEDDFSRVGASVVGFTVGGLFVFDAASIEADLPVIRIDRRDVAGALAAIERTWDLLAPDVPFRARFSEDLFAEAYAPFSKIGSVFVLLSVCALAISSTGLLGIAMHVAARRRRELGIRKTLGASALGLVRLLLVDFSKPILVANLLAWPLGYFAAQAFLQPFAERVPLTPTPFLSSLALTLVIAWAAVIGEVLKAASVRPAEVLRHA